MAKGIVTTVEVCSNEYTSTNHRFNSFRKAMKYVRKIANGGWHFIGVTRDDKEGYVYMTN